jgi:hypothetical protein
MVVSVLCDDSPDYFHRLGRHPLLFAWFVDFYDVSLAKLPWTRNTGRRISITSTPLVNKQTHPSSFGDIASTIN